MPAPYRSHALATAGNRNVCVVLSPSHEIKLFAEGVHAFSFRNARWHLLDLQTKYEMWAASVGNASLAERLFQTAVNLADAREGALFVVLRDPETALPFLVAPGDQLDAARPPGNLDNPTRGQLLQMLQGRSATSIDPSVLAGLARTDGATVVDPDGRLLAVGAILLHSEPVEPHSSLAVEGAGPPPRWPRDATPPCSRSARRPALINLIRPTHQGCEQLGSLLPFAVADRESRAEASVT